MNRQKGGTVELIQDEFTVEALEHEIALLLEAVQNARVRSRLRDAADKLGQGGSSARAA